MKRYNYMRKPERRSMVIERVRQVFADKGYHGTTVDDICKACGIAQGTLYVHFKNKDEVFRSVMYDTLDRIQELTRPADIDVSGPDDAGEDDLKAFIKQRISTVLKKVREDRALFRMILREARGLDKEIDEILSRINRVMLTQMETEIDIGRRMGLIRDVHPRSAAHLVFGTILIFIVTHFIDSEPPEIEPLSEEITDLVLYGLTPSP